MDYCIKLRIKALSKIYPRKRKKRKGKLKVFTKKVECNCKRCQSNYMQSNSYI